MNQQITIITTSFNQQVLMPTAPNKDQLSRLGMFIRWLDGRGQRWVNADLAAYRDYLLQDKPNRAGGQGLAPATVQAHLSTVRGRYAQLMRSNPVRQSLYAFAPVDTSPADKKAYVDECLTQLQNAVHPTTAPVKLIAKQDEAASEHLRLKQHQTTSLVSAPGITTLTGTRDTAIIALAVCTGIREAELVDLDVIDLKQRLGDELAICVRNGKGGKQRLVPYGAMDWCLLYVDRWLKAAGITEGAVFRGFYRGGKSVRAGRITTRAVNEILNTYPIVIDGVKRQVKPHDLRRSYARALYDAGMDIVRIQQNLGHSNMTTTLHYIGELNAEQRRPPAVFTAPHELAELERDFVA